MDNSPELIGAELRSARSKLRSARVLLDAECFEDSISRAYYAAFHAVKAALLQCGVHAQSHSGAKSLFGIHLVDHHRMDRKYARILDSLMSRRESSDYDVWNAFDREDAAAALREAEDLILAVETFLKAAGIQP